MLSHPARSRRLLFLAMLALATLTSARAFDSFGQGGAFQGLAGLGQDGSDPLAKFAGMPLEFPLIPPEPATTSETCEQFLRLGIQLNADRVAESCDLNLLTTAQLERVAREIRSQQGSCQRLEYLRGQQLHQAGAGGTGARGIPGGDFGLGLELRGHFPFVGQGLDRVQVRARTPIGSKTHSWRPRGNPSRNLPSRSVEAPLHQRWDELQRDVKQEARSGNLGGVGQLLTPSNLGTAATYQGLRSLHREARSNSSAEQRALGDLRVQRQDCERYYAGKLAQVQTALGRRR